MGYYLQAFICKQSDSDLVTSQFKHAININLNQGISLIPLTEDLFDEISNNKYSDNIDKFELLTVAIENKILEIVGDIKIAFVEAEYFGGEGGQMAIVWKDNKREYFLPYCQDKINHVLKDFGVISQPGIDEFFLVGLRKYRNTRDWLNNKS